MMGKAFKMRDLDPRDRSALYHMEPPLMGCEWVAARCGPWQWRNLAIELYSASPQGYLLKLLIFEWGTCHACEALGRHGYEVTELPREEPPR